MVSVVAVASRVSEGEPAKFTVTRTRPATKKLTVEMSWRRSDSSKVIAQPQQFPEGMSSRTPTMRGDDYKVVREDVTVTVTLEDGPGYRVAVDVRVRTLLVHQAPRGSASEAWRCH